MGYDVVIEGGLFFDGTGSAPGVARNVGIKDGRVVAVTEEALDAGGGSVIDARGKWVVPGFLDCHRTTTPSSSRPLHSPSRFATA